jgi:ribosomal protein L20
VKIDEAEVLAVWYLARKANKKCNRKLWVHPINQGRGEKDAYILLYKELMDDCTNFFNYLRMTPSSFKELLDKVRSSIQMQDTHLWKSISPQERLCLTLR